MSFPSSSSGSNRSRNRIVWMLVLLHLQYLSSFHRSYSRWSNFDLRATQWLSRDLLPRDSFKEGPPDTPDDGSGIKSLDVLEGNSPVTTLTVEELKSKWIDICIEQNTPEAIDTFNIASVLPLVVRANEMVQLVNKSAEAIEASILNDDNAIEYVTEQELERIWRESSLLPMGKGIDTYDCKSALLLLRDDEDESLIGDMVRTTISGMDGSGIKVENTKAAALSNSISQGTSMMTLRDSLLQQALTSSSISSASGSSIVLGGDSLSAEKEEIDIEGGIEFVVTDTELRRLWDERAKVPFGLPAPEYSDKVALMLLDDDDEDDNTEYISALHAYDQEDYERRGFWNEYTGREGQFMRETLKALHDDLEDMTTYRPAWKKDRHILTPDIDTQDFMGDLMWSNTYMTQRVPANWEDPEAGEMSETYLSTSTMAWPGEEETDYNFRPPPWERLNLPIGPNVAKFMQERRSDDSDEEGAEGDAEGGSGQVDWANFDFGSMDTNVRVVDENAVGSRDKLESDIESAVEGKDDAIDVESFFKSLGAPTSTDDASAAGSEFDDAAMEDEGDGDPTRSIVAKPMDRMSDKETLISRGWRTPASWVSPSSEFADHVGFEVWSKYPEEEYHGADDRMWEEDEWTAQSMKHVMEVTDLYLTDHDACTAISDEHKHWERAVNRVLGLEHDFEIEDIPPHLTPDKDRGVVYGDDLIEMKGKLSLHPYQDPPHIMFANDTFVHSTEFVTMNKIGTMREQYEWKPTIPEEEWLIEDHKLAAMQPLLYFANHVADLLSTKDDVLLFEYRGQMRHIIGIRDMMIRVAAEQCPGLTVKDIRLETVRTTDKFDR